jgi:demethylmenaquinone methyltransferase / 2-methoxy-6-polyprenyl-1,4-benzoquinol methylase
MQATRTSEFTRQLFDGLPANYDRQAWVLSMGQDRRWRRAMIDPVAAASPRTVLDVATGPAGVALQLARRTSADIVGIDLTPEMLRRGRANVRRAGLAHRVRLVEGSAERLPFPDGAFDALTFTYLLRYVADPEATVAELVRVVRPGGTIASLEFHVPKGGWHALWQLYTRVLLPAAGWVTGGREWRDVGRFLGPSISTHYERYPTGWHAAAWERVGVEDVHLRLMSLGGGLVMWGRRRG